MRHKWSFVIVLSLLITTVAGNIFAGEEAAEVSTEALDDETSLGLTIDLGWSSAYMFRGLNIFGDSNHRAQHMVLTPGIEWNVFNTGLSLGYWSAYQLNGSNKSAKIDEGLGAEQDLYVSYEWMMLDILSARASLTYYFYPGADKELTGVDTHMYLEPNVGLTVSFIVDWNLDVSYFMGLQDELRPFSYIYFNPSLSKEINILPFLGLFGKGGYGFKRWNDEYPNGTQNTHDLLLDFGGNIALGSFYLSPAVHVSWTNLTKAESKDYHYTTADDGVVVWVSLNVGAEF